MEEKTAKKAASNKSEVHPLNVVKVTMEDLTEADRKEIEEEIAREMEEKRNERLACFRKTKNGVIKQIGGASTSSKKVSSSVTCEELAHMIDTAVASKYGTDVTEITHMISEGVRNSFDTFRSEFKQDMNNNNMPRQIRYIVQQVQGELQGKRVENLSYAPSYNGAVARNDVKYIYIYLYYT
jgi:alanyl-tRNA synthetase